MQLTLIGSPTVTGSRSASSTQPFMGTQAATTTTHMMLSKFYKPDNSDTKQVVIWLKGFSAK